MSAGAMLVLDCGTTSLRFSIVSAQGQVVTTRRAVVPMTRDADGGGWDGNAIAACVLSESAALLAEYPVAGVAIANQRTTCLVWDAATSRVLGPVLGWSDGRTLALDRQLRLEGIRYIPNLTGSKLRWLLDCVDPDRTLASLGRLRAGTLDAWIVWTLTQGAQHATDHVNASHTGLFDIRRLVWDEALAIAMGVPPSILPMPMPCTGPFGAATALLGAPPILALVGDQQASLLGQRCVTPGATKITFGTVGAVSCVLGSQPLAQNSAAAFGNIALSTAAGVRYGVETSMQSAGSAIEWLIRIGVLGKACDIDELVDPSQRSEAIFVSALDGLGAPHWNPAVRAAFMGLGAADGKAQLARAVLDGIVCATAEILDLLEQAIGRPLGAISVDGGLAGSSVFRGILAATIDRPLVQAPHIESTTAGAAALGFLALGTDPFSGHNFFSANAQPIARRADITPSNRALWADGVKAVLSDHDQRKNLRKMSL